MRSRIPDQERIREAFDRQIFCLETDLYISTHILRFIEIYFTPKPLTYVHFNSDLFFEVLFSLFYAQTNQTEITEGALYFASRNKCLLRFTL